MSEHTGRLEPKQAAALYTSIAGSSRPHPLYWVGHVLYSQGSPRVPHDFVSPNF